MKYLNYLFLAFVLAFPLSAQEFPQTAFRLKYERKDSEGIITGYGTAFSVDLTKYIIYAKDLKRHYLITATHNVFRNGHYVGVTQIEYKDKWIPIKDMLVMDIDRDICILEIDEDLPTAKLAEKDCKMNDKVTMDASPKGVPLKTFEGSVVARFWGGFKTWVNISFDHGCSGAPLYNKKHEIVGIALSGIPKKGGSEGEMDETTGMFAPLCVLEDFIDTYFHPAGHVEEQK